MDDLFILVKQLNEDCLQSYKFGYVLVFTSMEEPEL